MENLLGAKCATCKTLLTVGQKSIYKIGNRWVRSEIGQMPTFSCANGCTEILDPSDF